MLLRATLSGVSPGREHEEREGRERVRVESEERRKGGREDEDGNGIITAAIRERNEGSKEGRK